MQQKQPNVIEMITRSLDQLRKSDRKVAEWVLSDPHKAINSTLVETAKAAGVSEPTVMRFSTAVGCSGFQDLKIRLAQSIALGVTPTHAALEEGDSTHVVSRKLFDFTLTSLDWARQHADIEKMEAAVELLSNASQIDFYGFGASGIVALDAQQKFPLFGVPCNAHTDAHQQFIASSMMREGNVVVAISNNGETIDLIETVREAKDHGAKVIAITGRRGCSLSQECDLSLVVETLENTDRYTPTISRIAALVVVDILATAVSLNKEEGHRDQITSMKERLSRFRSNHFDNE
ncbi:RpiR family transcriptional regulator [Vibrio nigripulchritudo]|uniref:MurR/RpiR family transcriptional regulator n=1 Tax=Vibrio nigripulchritudo TaxID=28173 RepID=UPI0009BA5702|nr:MurR/RpiR family transcriptional regulator [Vibrio nigripulchritudo]BCL73314.1 RpiR family transcriptional regulator [Vibrio nigripulchritudo]BDU34680.1 RpiR family transcriptional regulator [Vibrio nigripulchritudo]